MFGEQNVRLGYDEIDASQRNMSNQRFNNYQLSQFYKDETSDHYISFATEQPNVNYTGLAHGKGLDGDKVDYESLLLLQTKTEGPLGKVQLFSRPFQTVPYLGRGSVDPTTELMIMRGESVSAPKSTSTVMEQSFLNYAWPIPDDDMVSRVRDERTTVQEAALNGWVRGGSTTRT